MRGNHIVWGRVYESEPDATTTEDRKRITSVKLRQMAGYSDNCREVWKEGELIGFVRIRADGQYYKRERGGSWMLAGWKWGEGDPKWGLAILALLEESNVKRRPE